MPGSTPRASHGEISERLWIANAAAIDSTPKAEARTLSPICASAAVRVDERRSDHQTDRQVDDRGHQQHRDDPASERAPAGRDPPEWRACAGSPDPSGGVGAWAAPCRDDDIRWCPPPIRWILGPWTSASSAWDDESPSASASAFATPWARSTPLASPRDGGPDCRSLALRMGPRAPDAVPGRRRRHGRRLRVVVDERARQPAPGVVVGGDPPRPPSTRPRHRGARGAHRPRPRARTYLGRHRRVGQRRHHGLR